MHIYNIVNKLITIEHAIPFSRSLEMQMNENIESPHLITPTVIETEQNEPSLIEYEELYVFRAGESLNYRKQKH